MSRFILSIFMLFSAEVFCQQEIIIPEGYSKNVMLADSLAEAGIYSAAANAYTIAFRSFNSRGFDVDRLKAARVYALNNQVDSSISSLKRLITLRFYNYKKIEDDKAFKAVVISPQWPSVLESFKINKSRFGPTVNLTLLNFLDSILFPISDEINVDKRRKEVGLEPLASYVKRWDIVYVLPK